MSDAGDVDVLESETSRGIHPPVFVVGLLAVLAVVFLVGRALFFDTGGASSPEEAVRDLAAAISQEDLAGALAALSPNEVGPIADTYQAGAAKVKELGLTGEGGTFGFLDLEVSDLQLDVQELGPDVAKVVITGGTASGSFDESKLGPTVEELGQGMVDGEEFAESGLGEVEVGIEDESDESSEPETETVTAAELRADIDGQEVDPFVVVVRRDEGWYVSPFHTIAEYLMIGADDDVPRPSYARPELAPAAPSPIAAVQQLVDAVNARDVGAAIDSLSADEWAVLHTYRGAVEYLLEDTLGEIDPEAELTIDDIQFTSQQTGDERAVVVPKSFTAHVVDPESESDLVYEEEFEEFEELEGFEDLEGFDESNELEEFEEFEGPLPLDEEEGPTELEAPAAGPTTYTVEFDGTCLLIEGDEEPFDSCEVAEELEGPSTFGLDALEDVGIVVVAERGGWAISPLETVFGALTDFIESIDEERFAAWTGTESRLPPQAKVSMGESVEVTINDEGFAVVGVKAIEGEGFELTVDGDGAHVSSIVDPDGGRIRAGGSLTPFAAGEVEPEQTGEYRAVIRGTSGTTVTVSMAPYVVRSVTLGEPFDIEIPELSGETVRLEVPEDMLVMIDDPDLRLGADGSDLGGIPARWLAVERGDGPLEVWYEGDGAFHGEVTIVELEVEPLETTGSTVVELDEAEVRAFGFVASEGLAPLEYSDELDAELLDPDGELVWDWEVQDGAEYRLIVESIGDGPASGTLSFPPREVTIDGGMPFAEATWDPAQPEPHRYEMVVPGGQSVSVQVIPSGELDPAIEVSCAGEGGDAWSGSSESPLPHIPGLPDWVAIPSSAQDRTCALSVVGEAGSGPYTLSAGPGP